MNNALRLPGIALAALGLWAGVGTDDRPPLVRRDLIRTEAQAFPEIKRDPFSTLAFVADSADDPESSPLPGGKLRPAEPPPPPPPATVRYVGFVRYPASGAPAAIVLIDGRAWAVAEGETTPSGWSAVRITDRQIELRNPEGNTLVFLYEGERP